MAFNRLADHKFDAENPRTASRALPDGRLSRRFVWVVTVFSAAVFLIAAGMLNRFCLALALPTLAILLGYSYAKRFTSVAHLWLGGSLGLAPIGAWAAETGSLAWPPVVLGVAVTLWVAGFDVIYSLQDEDFLLFQAGTHTEAVKMRRQDYEEIAHPRIDSIASYQ